MHRIGNGRSSLDIPCHSGILRSMWNSLFWLLLVKFLPLKRKSVHSLSHKYEDDYWCCVSQISIQQRSNHLPFLCKSFTGVINFETRTSVIHMTWIFLSSFCIIFRRKYLLNYSVSYLFINTCLSIYTTFFFNTAVL